MKIRLVLALSVLLACAAPPPALATEASTASIEQLFVVTKAEAMVDSMFASIEQAMRKGMQQATQGRTLSEEQQRVLEAAPRQFMEVMRQEMSWATMKEIYIPIYRESFSEEEIQGLIAFYETPAGRAYVDKMPLVMQRSMAVAQQRMQPLLPKMKEAMEKALQDAKVAR
jgi:hypothetical protein